jgi:hypothetical protein
MARRQLREQCRDCGKLFGENLAHALATAGTPDLDLRAAQTAGESEREARERHWKNYAESRQRERDEESRRWWANYNDYLNTSEWRHRRRLVLDRANGVCEGCRERRATQVHHLTYKHVASEFLWELVAVCDECHQRVHG